MRHKIIKIIHITQQHKLPFGIKPTPEYVTRAVKSQLLIARAIKEHPSCPVLVEGMFMDIDINHPKYSAMSLAAKMIFPDGIPDEFNKLSDLQKEFLYEKGAANTLFYLGEIQSLNKAIHEDVSKMADERLKDKMEPSLLYTLREKELVLCSKEAAMKHFGTLDGATVLVVFGGGHDIKPYCDEENFDYELIKTHVTTQDDRMTPSLESLAKTHLQDYIQNTIKKFNSPILSTAADVKYQVGDVFFAHKEN